MGVDPHGALRPDLLHCPSMNGIYQAPRGSARAEVAGASAVNFLIGLWLIVAPWILGFDKEWAVWNAIGSGFVIAFVAFLRASGMRRATALSMLNAGVGSWLVLSALWLDQSLAAALNAIVAGGLVVVFALWSASASRHPGRPRADRP